MTGNSVEKKYRKHSCGECARFKVPDSGCPWFQDVRQGLLRATDSACDDFNGPKTDAATAASRDYFDDKGRFIPKLLGDEIMQGHHFITMTDNEETYAYLDGYYQSRGERIIKKECKERLLEDYRKNRVSEVIDYIKVSTYTKRREESRNFIPLQNGVLDLDKMDLKPYTPDLMFFNKIPVNYDPQADCPNIKKFHKQITNSEQDVAILEELLGYCLYRDYFIAKALMLVGGGSNGKSTWLALNKTFLGQENTSGRGLHDLEDNRFAKADLHTKLANIHADLPDRSLQRTGTFKMLTGKDLITAERKFQNPFTFVNYAKLLFSANKVPEAQDDTDAFFRRWIVIVFPNTFEGDKCDPHIIEKLTTDQELSGLLNLVLQGLKRLLRKGEFSQSKTTQEVKEDYIRKASPLAAFVLDCLETDSDAFIAKKELYQVFTEYCRRNSLPTVTQETFYKNLPRHATVADHRPTIQGNRPYTFKGIRFSLGVSNLSKVSRVFYTLIDKKADFGNPWSMEELPIEGFVKVCLSLDSVDMLDAGSLDKPAASTVEACFLWRRIPPAERCELCGGFSVEFEINHLHDRRILRRCPSCFDKMRREFANAIWNEVRQD